MEKICPFSVLIVLTLSIFGPNFVIADALQPARTPIFILGDSTADVGTNSYIPDCNATANFPHNGIDFVNSRPTGRFSNGFNSADHLARLFGYNSSPPPFLFLHSLKYGLQLGIYRGVNFASGGSGLLDDTGLQLINQFVNVRENLIAALGHESTKALLAKSLFCISTGSNDVFVYFKTRSTMPKEYLGSRKFGIISVPPVGCCPANRLLNGTRCFEPMNDFARCFHSALDKLMYKLSSEIHRMKYALGDSYKMTIDVIDNPRPFNFKNVDTACCGHGTLNAEGICNATANLCSDRKQYIFWDLFHPTHAAARLAANTLYDGPTLYVSPINFAQLAAEN
ncbi:hypothetical protein RND71_000039 [Anisodus tanguticus]|uniref:Uncharacterized protein n=1 Tax=Anisodus tanguticus TaxID=243964 RepID=A0AAE1SXY9_9SOLA|nr:hypothetical protein RND71_000039 [Anisodus tanguticus]